MYQQYSLKQTGVEEAIRAAGGQKQLARILGVTQQFISHCLARGYVPPARAVAIEKELGIPRKRLVSPRLITLVE